MSVSIPRLAASTAGLGLVCSMAVSTPGSAATSEAASGLVRCAAAASRQGEFAAASRASGVPRSVLLAVSYLESRWRDHAGAPSTSGGYGPMHLTDLPIDLNATGRGDGVIRQPLLSAKTLRLASKLTGLSGARLRTDPTANICGGAAVLAYFHKSVGGRSDARLGGWSAAVARYSGSGDPATAGRFVRQVYSVLRSGAAARTDDGRVRLAARPRATPTRSTAPSSTGSQQNINVDCPVALGCWWIPAPYEWYGEPDPYAYGNHDLADRPNDISIDYIIIHDTETSFQGTLDLVTDPTYVSWQYTLRSRDGQIAQHVPLDDVAWHAGNWYLNMHSIGLEHEGFAAEGASWYTEAMYRTSASLVRYLTARYDIPRDRAHIIGHDQVPGITPEYVAGMHWDPGPYWNWERYMNLIRSPIGADGALNGRIRAGDVVTVRPGFGGNRQKVTGCETAGQPCATQGTNFVYLRQRPSWRAPLVTDVGLHPDGSPSTTEVADIGARAVAGHEFVVAERRGSWVRVWWLGRVAWLRNRTPAGDPVLVRTAGLKVRAAPGQAPAAIYGRAYPEESAYPAEIPYQTVTPLQYTLKGGQAYSLADSAVPTDYYYAQTFDYSLPGDHTVVRGLDRYYQIWFGHRMAFVRADEVVITR
ncbi:MAG: N-acetylmuramoyl-L-alanine amidase [Nocardioidaceae bacterium]|nr:N-acetylmuramoyl-L-alanine amidase [Nocardioidaceae bacterium]